jgi:outer membrane autotransporter protein
MSRPPYAGGRVVLTPARPASTLDEALPGQQPTTIQTIENAMKRLAIAAAAAFALLGPVHAQSSLPFYGEIGYTSLKIEGNGYSVHPDAVRGIIGYAFHPYLALEGMLAGGINDDDTNVSSFGVPTNVGLKLQHAYGIYVKPRYEWNQVEAFGRLGWARSKVRATASAGGLSASESNSDDDFSYGAGVNYRFDPRMHVGVDYMVYYDKDNSKVNGWTISFGYRF